MATPAPPTFQRAACTSATDDDDRALVERFRQGDRAAFTALVVRYQRPLYQAAFWVLHRAEDAADVVQTVFLKAAERIDDYDPRYKFFSWIYRIAVNEALNVQRRRAHEDELEDGDALPDEQAAGPAERVGEGERAARLRGALMQLSADHRLVIVMRHFQELSYSEIAAALAVEEKTVKSRLFEARGRLRGLLADLEPESPGHGRH